MTPEPFTLPMVASVQLMVTGLTQHSFNGYPIIGKDGRLQGLITRKNLTVLMQRECWTAPKVQNQGLQMISEIAQS